MSFDFGFGFWDFWSKMDFENISTCHLPDARDRVEAGGEGVASQVPRLLRVDVPLQHSNIPGRTFC